MPGEIVHTLEAESEPESSDPSSISPTIFRGYSIRGIADRDLTDDVVFRIGHAVGVFFRKRGASLLVLGSDVRQSSPRISRAMTRGMASAGMRIIDVGIVPTPVHHFACDYYSADGAVMVTASHNPAPYNGLKIRSDRTLNQDEIREIYELTNISPEVAQNVDTGSIRTENPLPFYVEQVKLNAQFRKPLSIVVDGGNGANGPIVSRLLADLGCRVFELNCRPDGRFPDRDPDPTASGAINGLSESVQANQADLGVAYDGDGDRLVMVDDLGRPVLGDQLLMILARNILSQGPARIVYEVSCTQALADDVTARGGTAIMAPTGYAYVHKAIRDNDAALGGELSGHLFFNQPGFRFDDAILGTVRLINILTAQGIRLSQIVDELPFYYVSPPLRIECPDAIKTQVVERVKQHFQADWPVNELDGARIAFGDGWALVRASNTQPALTLRFEARTQERLDELTQMVMQQVNFWLEKLASPASSPTSAGK